MNEKTKNSDMEKFIQEGLLALLPRYRGGFSETIVFTLREKHFDPRGVPWLVERLASYYSMNLAELRRRCGRLLGFRHYISLPLSEHLVLLPVKMRQSELSGETTTGFINLPQVEKILPPPPPEPSTGQPAAARPRPVFPPNKKEPAWLSRVQFKCGLQLKTLNTPETLRNRLRQGETVLQDFLKRRNQGTVFKGLMQQELLQHLPNCDCLLKKAFIKIFDLKLEE